MPGRPLPALKSRQVELGVKGSSRHARLERWPLFDIAPPAVRRLRHLRRRRHLHARQADGERAPPRRRGQRRRRGSAPGRCAAGAQWLHARREGAPDPAVERPASRSTCRRARCKLQAGYTRRRRCPAWRCRPALVAREPRAWCCPTTALQHPRLDAARPRRCATSSSWAARTLTWRAGIDNLADRRAWKESPYQFGHVYLFPLAPRTWRAVGAGRPLRPRGKAGYNARLFLDSSVGRAPDC